MRAHAKGMSVCGMSTWTSECAKGMSVCVYECKRASHQAEHRRKQAVVRASFLAKLIYMIEARNSQQKKTGQVVKRNSKFGEVLCVCHRRWCVVKNARGRIALNHSLSEQHTGSKSTKIELC